MRRSTLLASLFALLLALPLHAALTVEPLTWNIMGLDSNDPATGPNRFPVGARVCSTVAATNVQVNFVWDSANAFIGLRTGSFSTISLDIGAGQCQDAYFEVEIQKNAAAFNTTRRYHITATHASGTATTPTPREIYVEHLISQSRNAISDVRYGPNTGSLTSVAPGGSMALAVGNTYVIQLLGGTATQGYNQFEAFINFANTVFQILDVDTSYSADDSPYVPNPNDKLYADACLWENDPNDPQYRSCVGGDFKAGGSTVVTTYTIRIIGGGGTNETLTTLLYDFSGSSFHYNADFGTSARIAAIIDPATARISKSFSPNPAAINGVSVLTFQLTNPNGGVLGGYNFVDNLPANLVVASTPGVTTSGCGTPSVTATAGSSSISFSNGTVAANGTCVVNVNVTPTATGTLNNTSDNLFVGTVDTGDNATASLTVNTDTPGTGVCGTTLARWNFESGFNASAPAPTTANVTASASPGAGVIAATSTNDNTVTPAGTGSWRSNGGIATGTPLNTANDDYFQFAIDTTGYTSVQMTFDASRTNNGPKGVAVYFGTSATPPGTQAFSTDLALNNTSFAGFSHTFNSGLNPSGLTYFRIYGYNSVNDNPGSDFHIDNVLFSGCTTAADPAISKSFAPDPIAVGATSTLTFTLNNSNGAPLTSAAFTDSLPAGVQVAATPAASTTCGGTWAPSAGATSLTFSGGTIPASGSCTVAVNVTATTAGPHANVSGFLSTTQSGTATGTVATDTLTALLPPVIDKEFGPSPVIPGQPSTLTFAITNPNTDNTLSAVAFTDTFPSGMTVASPALASQSGCGSPAWAPASGSGSVFFSGATIAGGGTCIVKVNVTTSAVGSYANTSGPVSHVINSQTVNGNTATDTLDVVAPSPSIALLKQAGSSPTGPWTSYLAAPGPVYYRFVVENTGDVPLSPISITDGTVNVSSCNSTFASLTLPVAAAANDNHIATCVVGPVTLSGSTTVNTATASGTFSATTYTSDPSSATVAVPALTLDKTASPMTFTLSGETINYSYLVTNSGAAPLEGPVTVADNKTTVTCPAVTTVGDLDNFLDPSESITCTATYLTTATDVTNAGVTNTATATVEGVNSNSDSVTVALSTAADVRVQKTLTTGTPYSAGQSVQYTIVINNDGPATATPVNVTDTPTNLTITNVSGACSALPCSIASIASGGSATITVTATINAAGPFDNSVTVSAPQPDPNPANNTDNTGNGGTATNVVDVSMVKTLNTGSPYTIGQSISYTLTVANAGPSTATVIQISDTPTNLTITNVSGACTSLPCTIASLSYGANTTINVTATINAVGPFDNAATATPAETDSNTGNNTDNTGNGGNAGPSADLSLVKTLTTSGPHLAGQSITYTLQISNAGPSAATGIDVSDTPSNLTITGVSGACPSLPCVIGSLASGANTTITVTATINAVGPFDNTASAFPDESDPNLGNNTDNSGNGGEAGPAADVSLVKTLTTGGPFNPGQSVTYTMVIANAGPSTATTINVTDTPANLTITNVAGACVTLPCTIASLASGANATITVTATINAPGAFDNSATAMAVEPDPNLANNTDNTGNGGVTGVSADVSIVKTLVTSGPYSHGQSITYTLVVANAGPSAATSINVTDTPANLAIAGVSGSGCAALPCVIASLASGANTTITVTATITAAGAFDNTATANATEPDPDPSDNTDNTGNGGNAAPLADVSIVKTLVTTGPYSAGQSITYTLVVANAGPSTATGIDVTDTPTNLTLTGVSGSGCAALPCVIASLTPGANTTVTVTATIVADGPFDNSATAIADEQDPNLGNNTDNSGNGGSTTPSADVSIVKTLVTPGPFSAGQSISYTLVVANAGPSVATAVNVTDTPTNLTITAVSGACSSLPCTIATLAVGASTTINVTATIVAAGSFDNAATANASQPDPDPTDNTDNTGNGGTTPGTSSVDLAIVKSVSATTLTVGDTFSYTLTVTNNGPGGATGVQVNDPLPPSFQLLSTISSQGTCSGTTTVVCALGSMANGSSVTITLTGRATAAGTLNNTATVASNETETVTANNASTAAPVVVAASHADIPTASEWGLMLLAAMLALAGVSVMRR